MWKITPDQSSFHFIPWQDDLLTGQQWRKVVEGAELDGGRVTERFGPEVKLTLLVRHEAGCSEEPRPDGGTDTRQLMTGIQRWEKKKRGRGGGKERKDKIKFQYVQHFLQYSDFIVQMFDSV